MTKEKLRSEFHKLIDDIDDESVLENFFEAISYYTEQINKKDVIDDLTETQKARLLKSIKQVSEKDTISNEKMKDEIENFLKYIN